VAALARRALTVQVAAMNLLRMLGYFRDTGRDADECGCYVCPEHAIAMEWAAHVPVTVRALLARGWRAEALSADAMAPGGRQVVTITFAPPPKEKP
jgi:hypothetical protein